ncbi:MAG: hypothetical protein Q4E22_01575, partial [Coriobacteriia bacterium]|nr:hypothetical protein [Coriobacteriia bacterium]
SLCGSLFKGNLNYLNNPESDRSYYELVPYENIHSSNYIDFAETTMLSILENEGYDPEELGLSHFVRIGLPKGLPYTSLNDPRFFLSIQTGYKLVDEEKFLAGVDALETEKRAHFFELMQITDIFNHVGNDSEDAKLFNTYLFEFDKQEQSAFGSLTEINHNSLEITKIQKVALEAGDMTSDSVNYSEKNKAPQLGYGFYMEVSDINDLGY